MSSGHSNDNTPPMSKEEKTLAQAQADLLNQQKAILQQQTDTQNLLAPYLYEAAGITPTMVNGKITGFTKTENPLQQQYQDIQKQFLDRTQAALSGDLPVDPALTRQLSESEQTLRQQLFKNLGSGYETSTPGIQALADFNVRKTEALDAARRGDLTTATQLGLGVGQYNAQTTSQLLSNIGGVSNLGNQNAQLLGNTVSGYSNAIQPYQNYTALQQQNQQFNAQQQAAQWQGIGTLAGTLGTTALGWAFLGPAAAAAPL